MKKFHSRIAPLVALGLAAGNALAGPPTTVTELANAVSFTDVSGAILAVSGVLLTLFVVWKGAKFVLKAVKGG